MGFPSSSRHAGIRFYSKRRRCSTLRTSYLLLSLYLARVEMSTTRQPSEGSELAR